MTDSKKIYSSQEYALSNQEMKNWAFTHADNYISAAEAAERVGMDLKDRSVQVVANTGQAVEVPVDISMYDIRPAKKLKIAQASVAGSRLPVVLIKGSSPAVKSAIWVTMDDFKNSDGLRELKQQIATAVQTFKDHHYEELRGALEKSLPALAKRAAHELINLKSADAIWAWFKKNGWDMGPLGPEVFDSMLSSMQRTGVVPRVFKLSSAQRWGHMEGTACEIDFEKKQFHIVAWSSSD